MTERKPCEPISTREIINAIQEGHTTSTEIADATGYHKVTIKRIVLEMYRAGLIIRHKIGQTYVYSVAEDIKPSEPELTLTDKEKRAVAREEKRKARRAL